MDTGRLVGRSIRRREDPRFLTGRAEYVDDLTAPGLTHLGICRSERAHAKLVGVDTTRADRTDGVIGVFTYEDVAASGSPGVIPVGSPIVDPEIPGHPVLAIDRVRYHGQPVAAVVAETPAAARDGVAAVEVDYDPLPAVSDPVAATDGSAPVLYEAAPRNVAFDWEVGDQAAVTERVAAADHTVELRLRNNRLLPSAIEPRAALAAYDPVDDRVVVEMTSQKPHRHRTEIATTLGLAEERVRVRAPAVGGGFGHKGHHHPGDALAVWGAIEVGRPVKWVASRSENYLAGAHARDHVTTVRLAVGGSGRFEALAVETHAGIGGYALGYAPVIPTRVYAGLLSGQYRIPAIHCRVTGAFTTTAPVHSYRGAGRPEAIYLLERVVDHAAREFGFDRVELRRRNQIPEDAFPYETPVGTRYDSGAYGVAFETAVDLVADDVRRARSRGGDAGDGYVGVGFANYVESTGSGPFEVGVVRVHPSGGVTAYCGTHDHGQGHETTYSQIVADELGVPVERVEVVEGDTERVPMGRGTSGSRSVAVGGSALARSAAMVREQAARIAAGLLEADSADVVREGEGFVVRGAPDRVVSFEEVAGAAYAGGHPRGGTPGLEETTFYEPDDLAFSFGTHAAVVRVVPETGEVGIVRYVAVDDCGTQINPRLVEGQIHGGVAQGIGQAVLERVVYDEAGSLVTGSLMDYVVPKASQLPEIETASTVTPCPHNPLGAKGVGEAGSIAAPPAVVNAVVDALSPLGVSHVDMPLTPESVWRACVAAESGSGGSSG